METNCKTCKHLINAEWEGRTWKQCEKQGISWKYEDCPYGEKSIKQLREAKESCLQTLNAIDNQIKELEDGK